MKSLPEGNSFPRRDFLRGLVALPLVGGAIELLGNPRAVALPATDQLMFEYSQWLDWELVKVQQQRHHGWSGKRGYLEEHSAYDVASHLHGAGPRDEHWKGVNAGLRSHAHRWHNGALPASARAALVLATVGCDWCGPYLT